MRGLFFVGVWETFHKPCWPAALIYCGSGRLLLDTLVSAAKIFLGEASPQEASYSETPLALCRTVWYNITCQQRKENRMNEPRTLKLPVLCPTCGTILAGREDVGTYTEVDGVIIFEVTCPGWISPDWKCCNSFRIDAGLAPVVEYVK